MLKAIVSEDGRLLCADEECKKTELRYHVLHHRKDVQTVRFDSKNNTFFLVEEPVDGDTLEVFDEYLRCPRCGAQHGMPDHGDYPEQETIQYEGDYLRAVKPDTLIHQCPKCGQIENVKHIEEYEISRYIRPDETTEDGETWLVSDGDEKIEYDGGGKNARMQCYSCFCTWAIPHNVNIET